MCQLVLSEYGIHLPKIFGFEGLFAIVPRSCDVSGILPDLEIVDGNACNVAPPSSDLGE